MKHVLKLSLLIVAVFSIQSIKPMFTAQINKLKVEFSNHVKTYNAKPLDDAVYNKFKADTAAVISKLKTLKNKDAEAAVVQLNKQLTDIDAERKVAVIMNDFE